LQNIPIKQAQAGLLEINCIPTDCDAKIESLQVTYNLKRSGQSELLGALEPPLQSIKPADNFPSAIQSHPLPLTLEQLKGAQTNDKFQPSIITNNC